MEEQFNPTAAIVDLGLAVLHNDHPLVAPFSAYIALASMHLAARDATRTQIAKVLGADLDGLEWLITLLDLIFASAERVPGECIITARSYVHERFEILDSFEQQIRTLGGIETVDFKAAAKTRAVINDYVAAKTNNKIQDLIPAGCLTGDTRAVLINTLYFKHAWLELFSKYNTKTLNFYGSTGNVSNVEMMVQTEDYSYFECEEFQVVSLDVEGYEFSVSIFLPRKRVSPLELFDCTTICEMSASDSSPLRMEKVTLSLPRFKQDASIDLKDIFSSLGIVDVFDSKADLKRMTDEGGLFVDAVLQKVCFEADEEGVEGAAATAVIFSLESCMESDFKPPKVFTADHSFLYVVSHERTAIPLFMGCFDPK